MSEISPLIAGADDIAPVAGLGSKTGVPEPASLGVLGTALVLLGGIAGRWRARQTKEK